MISTTSEPFTHSHSVPSWFAIRTKHRAERLVMRALERKGWECFLPAQEFYCSSEDELRPLFDGYVFCRFDPGSRVSILATPGVVGIAGDGVSAGVIAEQELATLRQAVESDWRRTPWPYTAEGPVARVMAGPLAGLEGIWASSVSGGFFILSIHALRCSAAFEIDQQCIQMTA